MAAPRLSPEIHRRIVSALLAELDDQQAKHGMHRAERLVVLVATLYREAQAQGVPIPKLVTLAVGVLTQLHAFASARRGN